VRFIDDHKIPGSLSNISVFSSGELKRTENNFGLVERIQVPAFDFLIESFGFENGIRQEEFVGEFLPPLLSQVCRADDKQVASTLGPTLRKENAGLDSFAETDFIGEDRSAGERGSEGEKRGFYLVGIEIDLGVCQG
jgi:hypothetical protein